MTPATAKRVADGLADRFTAHVEIEEVQPGRFRFNVFSRHFGAGSRLDRQDQAWAVIDELLGRDESDDVSLILTVGPEDVDASLVALMP
jgi:hypothetical protein